MNFRCLSLLLFSCLLSNAVAAGNEYRYAGAIICSNINDQVHILMGLEHTGKTESGKKGWLNFVGTRDDAKDFGDPVETASREAHEEIMCHIPKSDLRQKMISGHINPRVEEFVAYPLFIVYQPELSVPAIIMPETGCNDAEKHTFALIPLNKLLIAIKNNSTIGQPKSLIAEVAKADFTDGVVKRLYKICK